MERGRWRDRRDSFILIIKMTEKIEGTTEMFNHTFFFLVHIHQIHNEILYMIETAKLWDTKFKPLYMVSKNYSSDSNIALKDKRSRIWIHAVLSKGWGNCSKRLRWEFVSK